MVYVRRMTTEMKGKIYKTSEANVVAWDRNMGSESRTSATAGAMEMKCLKRVVR